MTIEHMIVNVAISTVLAALLVRLYFWEYHEYRVYRTRHNLFKIRAELFELGASKQIEFSEPAYGMLRTMINGSIRFAHRATLIDLVVCGITTRRSVALREARARHKKSWNGALHRLTPEVRTRIQRLQFDMHRAVVEQMFISSPIVWVIGVPLFLFFLVFHLWAKTAASFHAWFVPRVSDDLDLRAVSEGRLAQAAALCATA